MVQDHLIVDIMNEPDAYNASWTDGGSLPKDVATFYLDTMDALYPLCPTCLFQIQGCGMHPPTHLCRGLGSGSWTMPLHTDCLRLECNSLHRDGAC